MKQVTAQVDRDNAGRGAPLSIDRAATALCKLLADGVDVHRCAAAQALGRIGHPASIEALIAALVDEDEDVRVDAASALARYPDPRAAGPLLENLLGDPCTEVKLAAIEALGRLRFEDAIPWLRRLVRERDEEIAWDDDEFHASGWDDWTDIQIKAIEALAEIQVPEAAADILKALRDEDSQDLTDIAFTALARLGEAGQAALVELLDDENARHRKLAEATLAKLDGDTADIEVGLEAAEAAQENNAVEEIDLNAEAARLSDAKQPLPARLKSIEILATDGGAAAIETLAGILGDAERQIRLAAMSALVRLCSAEGAWPNAAGDMLLAALRGELVSAPELQPAAEKEPNAEEPTEAQQEQEADPESAYPTSTLGAMLSGTPQANQAMQKPEQGVELSRVDMERLALAVRKPGKRVVPVTPNVTPYDDVPRFAARVLGDIAQADVAVELAGALGEADRDKSLAAADSLCRIGEALGTLPREVVGALVETLQSTDRDLRLLTVRALGHSGDEMVAKRLFRCLRDGDNFVRAEAVRALRHLNTVGPEVGRLLSDPEPAVRLAAAEAIAAAQGKDALERLADFAFAFEGYHRRQAARLLRDLDASTASDRFIAVLDDPERQHVWQVAIEALEEIHGAAPDATDRAAKTELAN